MNDIVFSPESIISLALMAVLGIAVPAAAALVWRFRFHKGTLKATFIGAGMFFLFAMVLEQLLHVLMIPLVMNNVVLYVIYGSAAAGVFEETARFLSFRFFLKKNRSAENAVSYGLGHGGCEMILLLGLQAVIALAMIATVSPDVVSELSSESDFYAYSRVISQLTAYSQVTYGNLAISVLERIIALILQVSLSVLVMEAVMVKGRIWLYPAAIVIHALMDVPAALYQCGVIPVIVCELIIAAFTAVWAVIAYKRYKVTSKNLLHGRFL